jgi:hypothetical protein
VTHWEVEVTPPVEHDPWDPDARPRSYAYGGNLDFGPEGDVGRNLDPPIRSIPEFLRRLPEVEAIVAALPKDPPGTHVGESEHRSVTAATGKLNVTPTWIWAYRVPAGR